MKALQHLPRYRDPITRNVARLLLRSLQEQHRAPSSTAVELEARFGQQVGQVNTRRFEFPVATATAAVVDSIHSNLYTFQPGVTQTILSGVELALLEKGFAAHSNFSPIYPRYAREDVLFLMDKYRRLICAFGTFAEMTRRAKAASAVGRNSSSTSSPALLPELRNPFSVYYGVAVESAVEKRSVAKLDVCCPGWCADIRFSLATEETVPVQPREVLETPPYAVRYRNRGAFQISPFFTVYLTRTYTRFDTWWHPAHNVAAFCDPLCDAARVGPGTAIPTPAFFKGSEGVRQPHHGIRSGGSTTSMLASNDRDYTYEVEVEVNVRAVLRAWKRHYGGAAASAYLSSAELVSTTLAGTAMEIDHSSSSSSSDRHLGGDHFTKKEVRAFALAEREDPFLLRVSEDYMALLQFAGQLRTLE